MQYERSKALDSNENFNIEQTTAYFFQENTKKNTDLNKKVNGEQLHVENQRPTQYISTINAMKNPDIILSGSAFLKGNKFFKDQVNGIEKIDSVNNGESLG